MTRGLAVIVATLASASASAHPSTAEPAAEAWQIVVGVLLATAAVLYVTGLRRILASNAPLGGVKRSAVLFGLGWLTLALALVSPLAEMTEGLFSAHMIQHELLMVVAAPLMVLGRPLAIWTWGLPAPWRRAPGRALHRRTFAGCWTRISSPLAATVLHALAIWIWHVPRVFELSEASAGAHAIQHVAFLASALLFWWSLLKPARGSRVGVAVGCLFITMLHTSALGVLLTFSPEVWYPAATAHAHHWSLAPLEDQQLGGLVMWVVGSLPYVAAALALAARWFTAAEAREVALRATPR